MINLPLTRDEKLDLYPPLECFECGTYFEKAEEPFECPECKKFLCEDCALKHPSGNCETCEEREKDHQKELDQELEKEKTASKAA